jgi:hypothetical protein
MLLQRIRLKGFLGHRGSTNGGGDGFVEVDFSTAPLWLIHGPNGGGKARCGMPSVSRSSKNIARLGLTAERICGIWFTTNARKPKSSWSSTSTASHYAYVARS